MSWRRVSSIAFKLCSICNYPESTLSLMKRRCSSTTSCFASSLLLSADITAEFKVPRMAFSFEVNFSIFELSICYLIATAAALNMLFDHFVGLTVSR
ncbi:hypothetical protein BU25DRAFT_62005 [Macroventuria anomochaeta]|uniref:Uncharacterized protein n=1 Tax=Macroventuria anomochaeta TaxID=301207 RepID=A0ACB6RZB4_9PLEO|nr:uncharacterized protein BU25DRAFT_62005 [Macroventuria anomochaeta]KAF2627366.1 hypothetical protein BU25DRAFT_62005 [Macroventuria anomochaeta]